MSSPETIALGVFVAKTMGRLMRWTWLIPLSFIVMKLTDVQVLSRDTADHLVALLSYPIPVLEQQYGVLKELGRNSDAANFALYYLILAILFFVIIAGSLVSYFKSAPKLKIGVEEQFFILGGIVIFVMGFPLRGDFATTELTSMFRLYFDQIGLYHIRQFSVFVVLQLTFVLVVLAAAQTLGKRQRLPSEL